MSRIARASLFPETPRRMLGRHCTKTSSPLQSSPWEASPVGIRFGDIELVEIDWHFHTRLRHQLRDQAEWQTDHGRKISRNGIDQVASGSLNRVRTGLAETFSRCQVTFVQSFIE